MLVLASLCFDSLSSIERRTLLSVALLWSCWRDICLDGSLRRWFRWMASRYSRSSEQETNEFKLKKTVNLSKVCRLKRM